MALYSCSLMTGCDTRTRKDPEEMVDEIMNDYADPKGPGAAVLVMHHDSIILSKGYGTADLDSAKAVTPKTNFRLASVTKQFTAMGILLLAEKGALSLEDPLTKYFPDFPAYGREIRIRHLLTHTSGLVDYEDLIPDSVSRQVLDRDCLSLMHATDSLYFPAGSRYRYSNTGFALLALVTAEVGGMPFPAFIRKHIFDPLGMPTAVAYEQGLSTVAERAYGHSRDGEGWKRTDQSRTSAVLGDGGIYCNVIELATWVSSLWKNTLISPEMQRKAWSKAPVNDGGVIDYGYGWHLDGDSAKPHHDGSTLGFRNHILLYPETKSMVVVLTNRNEGEPRQLARRIAEVLVDR